MAQDGSDLRGEVHQTILEAALQQVAPAVLAKLNRNSAARSLGIVGPIVDAVDRRSYQPKEHFDNGYIDEGWDWVRTNLAAFRTDPAHNLQNFALAAHAISDFYAHTSYGQFAKNTGTLDKPVGIPVRPGRSCGEPRRDSQLFRGDGLRSHLPALHVESHLLEEGEG